MMILMTMKIILVTIIYNDDNSNNDDIDDNETDIDNSMNSIQYRKFQ